MKGLAAVYIISIFMISASCSNNHTIDSLPLKENVKQIIFFSNDNTHTEEEVAYFDALIELKKDFPQEVEDMMVFSSTEGKKYYQTFNIKSSPAIIVIYNQQVVANIYGTVSKDQIMSPISKALLNQ
jgi:hypothetical protein